MSNRKAIAPRNRSTRAERLERWNQTQSDAAKRFQPERIGGDGARYRWLNLVAESDLPKPARSIAAWLALDGNADGSKIYPGVRRLAKRTGYTQPSVLESLQQLVRAGYLRREFRRTDADGAGLLGCGLRYVLLAPKLAAVHCGRASESGRKVLNQIQHLHEVQNGIVHGAESRAGGAESHSPKVRNGIVQTNPETIPMTTAGEATAKRSPAARAAKRGPVQVGHMLAARGRPR